MGTRVAKSGMAYIPHTLLCRNQGQVARLGCQGSQEIVVASDAAKIANRMVENFLMSGSPNLF